MKYNELTTATQKSSHRVGRGIAAGQGKTAGRGTKGQKARAGSGRRPGFEGGQNPLMQRFPKLRGFTTHRTAPEAVYTGQLNDLSSAKVTNETLTDAGLITHSYSNVKLIVNGPVTKKLSVHLQKASASAIAAVEKAGGTFTVTARISRPKSTKKTKQTDDK